MKVIRSKEAKAKNWHEEPRAYYPFEDCEVCLVEATLREEDPPFHRHNYPELVFCLEGTVGVEVERPHGGPERRDLYEGDAVCFAPGESRRVWRTVPGAKLVVIKLGPPTRE